ncbi:hypothetical protein [Rhizorhabdus dicambivorans]|uniref:Uncharacterized protein n=1 Tax=Rhizorhabdus dicambivorans TaxID=1850238 RepID=A0A2A4G236_9SPHN|nr:hypothetical protein [Rhizorhabdus dicambivorans]ATE64809.1 hypothetical protein CMV14_10705 [Rhizorhabdus dicambivorans]PCE44086.1 hypothetical protein COO09_00090 [Rhizorhabdus dicambivorans]
MDDPEWTDADLALLQSLDAAGTPIEQIARRLGRDPQAIEAHLPIARARKGVIPVPEPRASAPRWNGPDEEGDVGPPSGRDEADPSAWVHIGKS